MATASRLGVFLLVRIRRTEFGAARGENVNAALVYGGNKREVTEDRATAIRRWVRKPDPQSQLMMG